ncbi:unnamed protein product [Calypogeia fissa]
MGSLLGWETSPSRSDQAMKRSNSSVTKEELEKFWRTKKLLMQEHLDEANKEAALSPRLRLARAMADEIDAQQKLAEGGMSMSMPETNSRAWWTKSRWAFLNDPPTVNVKESKYVAQFDVASLGQLQTDNPSY